MAESRFVCSAQFPSSQAKPRAIGAIVLVWITHVIRGEV
jgi:hypothetical protein